MLNSYTHIYLRFCAISCVYVFVCVSSNFILMTSNINTMYTSFREVIPTGIINLKS